MINIKHLRTNPEIYKKAAEAKKINVDIDMLMKLDEDIRDKKLELQNQLTKRNELTVKVQKLKKNWENADELMKEVRQIKETVNKLQTSIDELNEKFNVWFYKIPNPLADDVPIWKDDSENVELYKKWDIRKFDFEPKKHWELLEQRDLLDSKRGVKVSWARFVFIKDQLVLLELALINRVVNKMYKKWFRPMIWPNLVNEAAMTGTWFFPAEKKDIYTVNPGEDGLFLIGTSEVTMVSQHTNETIQIEDLPLRYVSFSQCYRREAWTYGKDTHWLIRLHQFEKVEMVSFVKPEDSKKEHELIAAIEEEIYEDLGIPFRKLLICSWDLWAPAAKKYDLDAWFPWINAYKEVTSCSNCTDFQSRAINCKYVNGRTKEYPYTLNGTAIALWRTMAAIVENYQTKDLRIKIPEVLKPIMGVEFI